MTSQSLFDALSSKEKIQELLTDLKNAQAFKKKGATIENQKIEELEEKLGKVRKQKDKLLRQLSDIELDKSETISFYNRLLLTLTEMLKNDLNKPLHKGINDFKKLVKKGSHIEILDVSFQKLKKAVLGFDTPEPEKETEKSKFSLKNLIRSDNSSNTSKGFSTDYLKYFKETYQDIINELCLELGEEYIERLVQLSKKIHVADHPDEFDSLRNEILNILQEYINNVSIEREKAAKLIADVVDRLSDVEQYFVASQEYVEDQKTANADFGKCLQDHVKTLKDNVEFSKNLEELRTAVVDKLQAITLAIQDKSKQDKQREKSVEKKVENLQHHLDKLKSKMAKAQKRAKSLEEELLKDSLTGAYNRRAYEKNMEKELQRYIRYKRVFSVLLFDVDHFKNINDTYGHAIGDKCLKEIIIRAGRVLRENDILARFGGEEFIALLPETELESAKGVAEKLRKSIENIEFVHKEEIIRITVSIGVTQVAETDLDIKKLFERMDMAMYDAKNGGRNRVVAK